MPEVSVITPMHNDGRTIRYTIESVQAQTFLDWEMVVVDDGSNDDSVQQVQSLAEKDKRIRLIETNVNMGPASARNKAIEVSCGRFIAFLDSDDLWHPEKLERQIGFMKAENEVFCYTYYYRMNQEGCVIGKSTKMSGRVTYNDLLRSCSIGCLTVVYDTSHYGKVYMPNIPRGQDYGLWLKLLKGCTSARLLPELLAYYRVGRMGSVSSRKFKKAVSIWRLYREYEGMSHVTSVFCLIRHSINSFRK